MNAQNSTFKSDQMDNLIETQSFSNRTITQGLSLVGLSLLLMMIFNPSQAQTTHSPSFDVVIESAMEFMQNDDYQAAIEALEELNDEDQNSAVQHLKGVCYFHMHKYDRAEELLASALENMIDETEYWNPNSGQSPLHLQIYLGRTLMAVGNFADAEYHFSQFLVSLHMMDEFEQWLMPTIVEFINVCQSNGTRERTANL